MARRRRRREALLSGGIFQVVADRDRVSFMYSYPNLIPLRRSEIQRIRGIIETLELERVYGAWWDTIVADGAKAKVLRSADRYIAASPIDVENGGPSSSY